MRRLDEVPTNAKAAADQSHDRSHLELLRTGPRIEWGSPERCASVLTAMEFRQMAQERILVSIAGRTIHDTRDLVRNNVPLRPANNQLTDRLRGRAH